MNGYLYVAVVTIEKKNKADIMGLAWQAVMHNPHTKKKFHVWVCYIDIE